MVLSSRAFKGVKGDFPCMSRPEGAKDFEGGLGTITFDPTCRRGSAYGFAKDGDLVAMRADGRTVVLVPGAKLPPGAAPGPAARARNVVTFGNWAADVDTQRVLWSLPDLNLRGPSIPAADRRLVAATLDGHLVGLTDLPEDSPGATALPAAAGPSAVPAASPAAAAAPLAAPSGADGLLLADGREVAGAVEALPGGRFRVSPAGGEPLEAAAAEVLLAQGEGRVLHRGGDPAILARWRAHLRPETVRAFEEMHAVLSKESLLRLCREVLDEAKEWGLSPERLAEVSRATAGRQENRFAEKRIEAVRPSLERIRAAARDRYLDASGWCRDRGFRIAAACLLSDADRLVPRDEGTERRAAELLPPGFPWAGGADAGRRWIAWAPEVIDTAAEWVSPDDPAWGAPGPGPWTEEGKVLVLRTANLILRTRCVAPEVVGRSLRNGEWTVRALVELLGAGAVKPVVTDDDRMDVRIHASEEDYRSEESPAGGYPMPWSAGYYSPLEGVSRFFVPGPGLGDPLGRGLFEVLSHELTHHFVETRWRGARRGVLPPLGHPGYWCVEGLARFVEDQVVEMDRRGLRFDDPTVPSIDSVVQACERKVLFRPTALLDMSKIDFLKLSPKPMLDVTLRNTLQTRRLSALGLFYEQAGATVWYLVNERGSDGRLAFLVYLSAYYSGKDPGPGWKALGYTSAKDCDETLRAFFGAPK
jgi:hypothetical protein